MHEAELVILGIMTALFGVPAALIVYALRK